MLVKDELSRRSGTVSDNEFKGSFSGTTAPPDQPHPATPASSTPAPEATSGGKRLDGLEQIALHDKIVEALEELRINYNLRQWRVCSLICESLADKFRNIAKDEQR
jgi:hypothetical protein